MRQPTDIVHYHFQHTFPQSSLETQSKESHGLFFAKVSQPFLEVYFYNLLLVLHSHSKDGIVVVCDLDVTVLGPVLNYLDIHILSGW